MGRGRQKAKATRQARDIKYYSPATDLSALQRELGQGRGHGTGSSAHADDSYDADYAEYADRYSSDDDEGESRRIG
ncbi:MAG: DUF3073 domain-containing protein [Arthrobacter sp.]|uniref:DUF3073 domain-containing protein n=1 Tax=unclassified Arthrobacter TaxID=235627 RepID=UPI00264AF78E|nr:DUF3073 domain-containing protein [Micrococcaceae bacterium]MDN5812190.1 DUF3073 domain-containing protein [Micrococcaceae bacterium]MDN5823276.1 DUF3073 domain-containing protein [Micrococcaceae bacterium]MDN5879124.1 DUF3073 domain-containing protein [Micrococcaceae bacterium]MDN5886820.1 DUF3073 domain-containing protein [Micrococcaceae bacterium]